MYSTGGEKRGGQGNWKGEKGKEKTRSKKVIVKVSVMADEEEVDTGCCRQHALSASTTRKPQRESEAHRR